VCVCVCVFVCVCVRVCVYVTVEESLPQCVARAHVFPHNSQKPALNWFSIAN